MRGQSPSPTSPWYTEPLRRTARILAATMTVVGSVLVILNQSLDVLPASYRGAVSWAIGAATVVLAVGHIIQGELGRSGFPGIAASQGVTSPAHVHQAMIASAQQPLAADLAVQRNASLADLGAALGLKEDGSPAVRRRASRRAR